MSHYYQENPKTPSDRKEISCRFNGVNFTFQSDSDVFSKRKIDFGTALLLDSVIRDLKAGGIRGGRLLDLGCGYGAIGIVLQRVFTKMEVILSDINKRAVSLARENARDNSAERVRIIS